LRPGQEDFHLREHSTLNARNHRLRRRPVRASASRLLAAAIAAAALFSFAPTSQGQTTAPTGIERVAGRSEVNIAAGLAGRKVDKVEVRGNKDVSSNTILNLIRTRAGEPLDPTTVQDDYQRIYELRRFANVEAQVQPTADGVIVAFVVTEQRAIKSVHFRGMLALDSVALGNAISIRPNESIDNFRIALARRAIEQLYKSKNYPLASVAIDPDALSKDGDLVFVISEGPSVRIRNVDFIGNKSFTEDRLKSKIKTRSYFWILRAGTIDDDTLDDDVASVREYYRSKGFFDARVGRRLLYSPDQTSAQVEFLIDEGPRYVVDKVTFVGNVSLTEAELRKELRIVEGSPYDSEVVDRDVRKVVDHFAPLGFIYEPGANDPDYLTVRTEPRFQLKPGTVELVYRISEGKPFNLGNIEVRGNSRTKDKVVLREFRKFSPGDLFNATAIRDASERLKGIGLFDRVKVTPVGTDPAERDLVVEVEEAKTASLTFGGGINSNGGLSANATYTERNFDITDWPNSFSEILDREAFVGAGENFRLSLEPGTESTNASIRLTEPFLFDQPYSMSVELFLRDREREHYDDHRIGGNIRFGHRFNQDWTASIGLRAEHVNIENVRDEPVRAYEILQEEGSNNLTSVSASIKRDTTNPGPLPYRGTSIQGTWESYGVLGGDYTFQKFTASYDNYHTLYDDLLDRKTVLSLHADAGYITGDSVFFERFYGGGIGSVRGFAFRGISPRSGPADDQIGGEFSLTGTAEIGFPISGDQLRGVVFVDGGTVEEDLHIGTIRTSVGAGVRVTLPVFGQIPIAVDFAIPITKDEDDDTQLISFSLGFIP
jgi:outer membrane protein assembly complex protein YaeT